MPEKRRHDYRNALFTIAHDVRIEAKILALRDGQNFSDWVGRVVKEEVERRKTQEKLTMV